MASRKLRLIALGIGLTGLGGMCSTSQWQAGVIQSRHIAADSCIAYERFNDLVVDCWMTNITSERLEIDMAAAIAELPDGRKEPSAIHTQKNVDWGPPAAHVVALAPNERRQAHFRFHATGWDWDDNESVWIELRPGVRLAGAPLTESLGIRVRP